MQPAVLSVVDGKNFLLGTFDTTGFQNWWKSETFPGEVESIQRPLHVYGQYHVCICKMSNGTYSIYRTKNNGKSWTQVYNTSDIIYTLTLIDYGWIIGSTSVGWIESWQDSGYTWNKISSFAPGCQVVVNIGDDILFAHDGYRIWRSVDYAKTWSIVLTFSDMQCVKYYGNRKKTIKYNNFAYPALAGVDNYLLVGVGPYLLISDDYGSTWHTHWCAYGNYKPGSTDPDYGRVPPFNPNYGSKILQLVVTRFDMDPNKCSLICRVLIVDSNVVEYWYCGLETQTPQSHSNTAGYQTLGSNWKILFSYPYRGPENGSLESKDVLRVGSPERELLTVFSTYDSKNNTIIKYSDSGGYIWKSLDPTTVIVYEGDPTQEIYSNIGQQVFEEEYFVEYIWSGLSCHNKGNWIVELNKTVRGLSWDQSLFLKSRDILKSTPFLYTTLITKHETYLFDILSKKKFTKTYTCSAPFRKMMDLSYLASLPLQTTFIKDFNMLNAMARRIPKPYDMRIYDKKSVPVYTFHDLAIIDTDQKTYKCDIRLINDHIEEIISSVEKYTPQMLDIEYLDIPYKPYDSRRDPVVP